MLFSDVEYKQFICEFTDNGKRSNQGKITETFKISRSHDLTMITGVSGLFALLELLFVIKTFREDHLYCSL